MTSRPLFVAAAALVTLAALAAATPAAAELPPEVYARARAAAVSVIVVALDGVDRPRAAFDRATCVARGRVVSVERGRRHTIGQAVEIKLPCIGTEYQAMPGPFPGYPADALGTARRGRFFLDADGALVLGGFDPLPAG